MINIVDKVCCGQFPFPPDPPPPPDYNNAPISFISEDICKDYMNKEFIWSDNLLDISMDLMSKILFRAEVDRDEAWLFQVFSVIDKDGNVYNLTETEMNELYLTFNLSGFQDWSIYKSIVYYFNMKQNYVKGIITDHLDLRQYPKINYGEAYDKYTSKYANSPECKKRIREFLTIRSKYETLWKKLTISFKNEKNVEITDFDFNKKVFTDMSLYFGPEPNSSDMILNDIFKESYRPEMISIPKKFFRFKVSSEFDVIRLIEGMSFSEFVFNPDGGQGIIKKFNTLKECIGYFWSIFEYLKLNVTPEITQSVKYYYSNRWPIVDPIDPNPPVTNNKYEFKIVKFFSKKKNKDVVFIEAEIWDHGVVYELGNYAKGEIL